jgi:hypothetical protein
VTRLGKSSAFTVGFSNRIILHKIRRHIFKAPADYFVRLRL